MASLITTVRDLERLRQIVLVLARHGFGEIVQRTGLGSLLGGKKIEGELPARVEIGERLRLVVQDLGPSFVKLGQIVSTRPDIIPADIIRELKKLQDAVPPVPFDELREHVEKELGAPLDQVFAELDELPLASASIGQVHRAKLRSDSGEPTVDVVVKIQRPGIKNIIDRDVDLLYWLARAVERSIPESRIYSPVKLVGEFDRAIQAELDFILEADNAERFSQNFEGWEVVRFPHVHRAATSRRVITLEFLDGKKVYDAVDAGASGERIAKAAVKVIIKQIFEDGFFHADPHPGNVFILGEPSEPVLAMIDLGLVGRLTPKMRDRTIDLMVAAVRKDYRGIADALYSIGKPTKKIDRDAYEAEVAVLADKYLGKKLSELQLSAMIRDLVYGATKYGLEIPPDFLMVGKALMTVEGVGKEIYPELDVLEEVKPYFLELLRQRYSPERIGQDLLTTAIRLSGAASDMPMQMQEILDDLRKGSLSLQVHEPALRVAADQLGRRVFSGLAVSGMIVGGALLFAREQWLSGALFTAAALSWASLHTVVVTWLGRKRRHP
jgi:ubiquinone biosynthesis protein